MGKRNRKPLLENIEIRDLGARAKGIGQAPDGRVVFVPYTAPGDMVDVQTVKKRKQYYEGKAVRFHRQSDMRTAPRCPHYGICGGCQLQHIPYEKQLAYKHREVVNNFRKIGGLSWKTEKDILASPRIWHYRNKMEYAFTSMRWLTDEQIRSGQSFDRRGLGFHVPGHWDKILDIEDCALQPEPGNRIRNALRDFARERQIPFYHPRERTGLLRQLTLRITRTGDVMVLVHFAEDRSGPISEIMSFLETGFPEITSLLYLINPKPNDSIYDLDVKRWAGKPYITERIGDLEFRIKPKSFFQTNTYQTENLYRQVMRYADIRPTDTVYDLYSGTGSIALFAAREARFVLGIETLPEAVDDALFNARLNGIENVDFRAGDVKDLFDNELVRTYGRPDVLIVDPPREGLHRQVTDQIVRLLPRRIVYVSCHSATQARDLERMKNFYEISLIQPVDMFPQTRHVENIAVLERKTNEHA